MWGPEDLLAILYAGPEAVKAFVKGAVVNTDDNMYVEFQAPEEMFLRPEGGIEVIFSRLSEHGTPLEAVLTEPHLLFANRDRLRNLVTALERRKRPTERYMELLAELN